MRQHPRIYKDFPIINGYIYIFQKPNSAWSKDHGNLSLSVEESK